MNIIQQMEHDHLAEVSEGKRIDDFAPGDTVKVNVRIVEGANERVQAFEGIVIAKKNRGLRSAFTVRKISHGEGVERVFPLYSPRVDSVERIRRGQVRRAKLYYLRGLTGKAARIREKVDYRLLAGNSAAKERDADMAQHGAQASTDIDKQKAKAGKGAIKAKTAKKVEKGNKK